MGNWGGGEGESVCVMWIIEGLFVRFMIMLKGGRKMHLFLFYFFVEEKPVKNRFCWFDIFREGGGKERRKRLFFCFTPLY